MFAKTAHQNGKYVFKFLYTFVRNLINKIAYTRI